MKGEKNESEGLKLIFMIVFNVNFSYFKIYTYFETLIFSLSCYKHVQNMFHFSALIMMQQTNFRKKVCFI